MSEPLAEARVLIVPDLSQFSAQLKTQLAAQIKAVEGATVAVAAKTKATRASAVADEQAAGAAASAAQAARVKAAADRDAARAAAQHAAAQSQLARGAGATGLSLLGIRGATLAAGSSFLIGAAAITVLAKSVKGAIDDQETLFGVTRILGQELGEGSKKWSQTLANSFGIADDEALKFEGAIAATLKNARFLPAENAKISQSLVELAADLAAVRHVPVADTLRALQLAVSGNARSLRQYGIVIQNTEVQQRALTNTGKATAAELTRHELTVARLAIIYERAAFAQGGFEANSGSLANKSKILNANLDSLGDTLGATLLPVISKLADKALETANAIEKLIDITKKYAPPTKDAEGHTTRWGQALHELGVILGTSLVGIPELAQHTFPQWNKEAQGAATSTEALANATRNLGGPVGLVDGQIISLGSDIAGMQGPTISATNAVGSLGAGLTGLLGPMNAATQAAAAFIATVAAIGAAQSAIINASNRLLDLQFQGAPSSKQKATLQTIIEENQKIIAATGGRGKRAIDARRERNAAQAQIDALDAKDAAAAAKGAKASASAGKSAAQAAQEAADAADQKLHFEQQLAQGALEIAAAKAQHTKSLVDDVKNLQDQLRLTNRQIVEAAKIHDAQTRLNTIQQLQLQAVTLQNQIDDQIAEQAARRRQRKLDALQSAEQLASLDAQIAEITGNKDAQINALLRLNAGLEKEKNAWKGNRVKQKELTLEILRNNEQIKELRKAQKENTGLSAAAQFEFLTTQAGFAANLLGNLIPRGVAAGTVGGTLNAAISTPTGPGPAGFATAAHQRDLTSGVSTAAQVNAGVRGASSGQMSSLISIQRSMLHAILTLTGQRAHPETTYQRQTSGIDFNVATGT